MSDSYTKGAINQGYQLFNLFKKHLQKRHIFRRDREPSRIPAQTQGLLSNKSRKVREFVYEFICSSHRRTGTFGLGGGGGGVGDLVARKNYSMPECVSVEIGMQTHSNCVTNINVHDSLI